MPGSCRQQQRQRQLQGQRARTSDAATTITAASFEGSNDLIIGSGAVAGQNVQCRLRGACGSAAQASSGDGRREELRAEDRPGRRLQSADGAQAPGGPDAGTSTPAASTTGTEEVTTSSDVAVNIGQPSDPATTASDLSSPSFSSSSSPSPDASSSDASSAFAPLSSWYANLDPQETIAFYVGVCVAGLLMLVAGLYTVERSISARRHRKESEQAAINRKNAALLSRLEKEIDTKMARYERRMAEAAGREAAMSVIEAVIAAAMRQVELNAAAGRQQRDQKIDEADAGIDAEIDVDDGMSTCSRRGALSDSGRSDTSFGTKATRFTTAKYPPATMRPALPPLHPSSSAAVNGRSRQTGSRSLFVAPEHGAAAAAVDDLAGSPPPDLSAFPITPGSVTRMRKPIQLLKGITGRLQRRFSSSVSIGSAFSVNGLARISERSCAAGPSDISIVQVSSAGQGAGGDERFWTGGTAPAYLSRIQRKDSFGSSARTGIITGA